MAVYRRFVHEINPFAYTRQQYILFSEAYFLRMGTQKSVEQGASYSEREVYCVKPQCYTLFE